jgi:hypothetical protein
MSKERGGYFIFSAVDFIDKSYIECGIDNFTDHLFGENTLSLNYL